MKKLILSILILLHPAAIIAADSDRDLVTESSLRQIQGTYADAYLTYGGAFKGFYGNALSKVGIKLSQDLEKYMNGRDAFKSSVRSFNMFVGDYSLNLDLSPAKFKAQFNDEVKRRLGEKALKGLNLDVNSEYPAVVIIVKLPRFSGHS